MKKKKQIFNFCSTVFGLVACSYSLSPEFWFMVFILRASYLHSIANFLNLYIFRCVIWLSDWITMKWEDHRAFLAPCSHNTVHFLTISQGSELLYWRMEQNNSNYFIRVNFLNVCIAEDCAKQDLLADLITRRGVVVWSLAVHLKEVICRYLRYYLTLLQVSIFLYFRASYLISETIKKKLPYLKSKIVSRLSGIYNGGGRAIWQDYPQTGGPTRRPSSFWITKQQKVNPKLGGEMRSIDSCVTNTFRELP